MRSLVEGWMPVKDQLPPKGEIISLGILENGKFSSFESMITRPYKHDKHMNCDMLCYEKDDQYHFLRTDMFWKESI